MNKVKNGKFRCKLHNQPVVAKHTGRQQYYCSHCDHSKSQAQDYNYSTLRDEVWQLKTTLNQATHILSDMSFLVTQLTDNDTLDSFNVADVFCMVESKYIYLQDILVSYTNKILSQQTNNQLVLRNKSAKNNSELSELPVQYCHKAENAFNIQLKNTSKSSTVTIDESDNLDYDKILSEITNTMLTNQVYSSDEYPADEAKNNLSYSGESTNAQETMHDTETNERKYSYNKYSPSFAENITNESSITNSTKEYIQCNLSYKLTSHNKKLFEKWNKKYFNDIKNIKYKSLSFCMMREIKNVPSLFNYVNFVRHSKYQSEVSLLLYDESEMRLYQEEDSQCIELKQLLKNYTGLKIGFNLEYHSKFDTTHVTCMASSNKGNYVLIGYSDGTLNKRNLKYELLKSYSLEANVPILGCIFNDNDSVILIAQARKILSVRADTLEYVREFTFKEDIAGIDTWHGYIYVGLASCFEVVKYSNPNFRVLFQYDWRVERFKIGRTGDYLVLISGAHSIDIIHHSHSMWKVVHRLEFKTKVVNMDFLGEYLVVILEAINHERKIITFKMTYL
eukprot:Mrub_01976.p1 GENE.Mrub_01976~~Mrub_01976.p1  ORF type:complete len:616 (+),score=134.55 Mrub_01976:160-1848(+)